MFRFRGTVRIASAMFLILCSTFMLILYIVNAAVIAEWAALANYLTHALRHRDYRYHYLIFVMVHIAHVTGMTAILETMLHRHE